MHILEKNHALEIQNKLVQRARVSVGVWLDSKYSSSKEVNRSQRLSDSLAVRSIEEKCSINSLPINLCLEIIPNLLYFWSTSKENFPWKKIKSLPYELHCLIFQRFIDHEVRMNLHEQIICPTTEHRAKDFFNFLPLWTRVSLQEASILVLNISIIFGKPSQWLIAVTLKKSLFRLDVLGFSFQPLAVTILFCAIEDQILFPNLSFF